MADFKYEFPTKFEEATGNSTKAIKKITKKGKNGYEVRTSTYMSEPEMKLVADAMGMELKSYLKSTNIAVSVFESVITEARYNKKSLLKKLGDADDATIQTGNGKEYIIYNPDSNNDDNAAMWNDNSVFAVDQDGEEHEIAYKDIGLVMVESTVTEAKFVKDFNRDVLKAKTKEEVLELYPNAQFFIGKSDHFFGELDGNLFFKAYYTKAQKEFEIKSVYSEKGSNYVHLYNESVVNEAEIKSDDEFKEYAFTVLKKAFADDFDEEKGQEIVDGILSKSDGDYGAAVGMLTSSLG